MQIPANTADPGNPQDVKDGQPPPHFKVHFRCVKDREQLTSLLGKVSPQGYAIEMRHNMYIIRTKTPVNQKKFMEQLLNSQKPGASLNLDAHGDNSEVAEAKLDTTDAWVKQRIQQNQPSA